MKKIIAGTVFTVMLVAVIAAPIVYFYSLHHLPNVAYFDDDVLIFDNTRYYNIGATNTNSFPKALKVLGEVKPNDFHTMFLYTRAVFAIEGIDESSVLVVKTPRGFVVRSSDPNLTMESLEIDS